MEKLVRISTLGNQRRTLGISDDCGTQFEFRNNNDGTISLAPLCPSVNPYISSIGLDTAAEYLMQLLDAKVVNPIRMALRDLAKKMTVTEGQTEQEALFELSEDFLQSLPKGSYVVKLIEPGKPKYKTQAKRRKYWATFWETAAARLQNT